jgi:hypothetical protein
MVPNGSSSMISMSASSDALVAEGSLREKRKADPAMALVLRKLRRCMLVLKEASGWMAETALLGKPLL